MPEIKKLTPKDFPVCLKEIPQPATHLYLEGELPSVAENTFLAVVGSRKFSAYGREVCEQLISGLAGYPIVIVSGLALGIDTIAHESALRTGLLTVAIPGSGLDRRVLYPSINRRLIIEATEKSGTLITARMALDYNRDVLAVPGSIFNPGSFGTNRLIKQGATPITTSADLLEALHFDLDATRPSDKQEALFADLSAPEKKIVELLKVEPLPRDEVLRQSGLSIGEAGSVLMILEIKGVIKETGGEIRLMRN
ncbi:MAG: DNA-processing protein DprA [Candidatus Vogelbacteria bacterium]|nr:DNA-processing protein DprA [Candidatus Vogelbacteria bacterium]